MKTKQFLLSFFLRSVEHTSLATGNGNPLLKPMKILFCSVIFLIGSTLSALAQPPCSRHYEPEGRFSYCAPKGWVSKDPVSGKYKTFTTPLGGTVIANFNVKDEVTALSNDAYMAAALRLLLDGNEARGTEARKVIGWTKFVTDSKIKGSRMIYEMTYKGMQMRMLQYVLDLPGRKLLITGTAIEKDKNFTDELFESVAKSVKIGAYRPAPVLPDARFNRPR